MSQIELIDADWLTTKVTEFATFADLMNHLKSGEIVLMKHSAAALELQKIVLQAGQPAFITA